MLPSCLAFGLPRSILLVAVAKRVSVRLDGLCSDPVFMRKIQTVVFNSFGKSMEP